MTKSERRLAGTAARRARSAADRAAARAAISAHLLARLVAPSGPVVDGMDPAMTCPAGPPILCAYLPLASEPLDPALPGLLADAGWRVLVPVTVPGAPLDWVELGADVAAGPLGVPEPTGPRLGAAAIRDAQVVLVPALAVDHRGGRLGRGGGFYDRSLALLADAEPAVQAGHVIDEGRDRPRLIAVVFDDEYVTEVPTDPHDRPVDEVVTPTGGLRKVASAGGFGASSN